MALNFSQRPMFPAHLSEDNLVSPMMIANGYFVEGVQQEREGDAFARSRREVDNCFDYGSDNNRADRGGGSQESISNEIVDLLPSDPFGMDISTTFTAITGWLEDLEVDYGGYGRDEVVGVGRGDYELFAGLNFIWNNAMRFQALPGNLGIMDKSYTWDGFGGCSGEKQVGDVSSCCGNFGLACNIENLLSFRNESCSSAARQTEEVDMVSGSCSAGDDGSPHSALFFALGYLGTRDLLAAQMVCRSLRSAVKSDPLLWRTIHIDKPLNEKVTDESLIQLSSRAEGNLQYLSLVDCQKITDDGLKRLLDGNPRLTKLSVPGCTRLGIEGIVNILKAFKSTGKQGIKHIRISGLFGVEENHYEELKLLLGMDQQTTHKPHFHRRGNFYISCDDDRAIDIELCPICHNFRVVYDCTAEGCQGKEDAAKVCRACVLCIPRCFDCGRCVNDDEYEETFCLELLCSDCRKPRSKWQESQDRKVG